MSKKIGCSKDEIKISNRCIKRSEAFRPIKSKYGIPALEKIGFYCYKSDRDGDWHRNNKLPGVAVLSSYQGYVILDKQTRSGKWGAYSDNAVGGYENKIKPGDTITLKKRLVEVLKSW